MMKIKMKKAQKSVSSKEHLNLKIIKTLKENELENQLENKGEHR